MFGKGCHLLFDISKVHFLLRWIIIDVYLMIQLLTTTNNYNNIIIYKRTLDLFMVFKKMGLRLLGRIWYMYHF